MWHSQILIDRKHNGLVYRFAGCMTGIEIFHEQVAWTVFTMYWPAIMCAALIGEE